MSIGFSTTVGKTKINVEAKGCVKCGSEHASGWAFYQVVPIIIGNLHGTVNISICADCLKNKKKGK
jgi:hypothetical protein